MIDVIKRYKPLGLVLILALAVILLVSCQAPVEESEKNIAAAEPDFHSKPATPEPILPSVANSTLQLTPIENMGITGLAPDVDIDEYRLTVSGLVDNQLSLTYEDILAYPSVTEIGVIDCPGFFTDFGEWTGVPVTTLLEEAGVKPEATKVTIFAIDGYNQTQTLEHIDKYSLFLAYIVNGVTLPPEHGYPLRVVDNGSTGAAWVKWVEQIIVE